MYNRKEDQFKIEVKGGTSEERDKLVYVIGHSLTEGGFVNVDTPLDNTPYQHGAQRGLAWSDVYKELTSTIAQKKITVTGADEVQTNASTGFYSSRATLALRDQLFKVNEAMKKVGVEEELTKETDVVLYGFDLDSHDGSNMA